MSFERNLPQISVLRDKTEQFFGKELIVHNDFILLADTIFEATKHRISETTLERVWGYSTRGYENVSIHTLNVLSYYLGYKNWSDFLSQLTEESFNESDMFDSEFIETSQLEVGDMLRIGWQPDRICTIKYLGDNTFVAIETQNSKMQPGDQFICLQFRLKSPLYLERFQSEGENKGNIRYGIGLKNGLTMLELLRENN